MNRSCQSILIGSLIKLLNMIATAPVEDKLRIENENTGGRKTMKLHLVRLLKTFEYDSLLELGQSLAPSLKYKLTAPTLLLSLMGTGIENIIETLYGLDGLGFGAIIAVFVLEVLTGIASSMIQKEKYSSARASRFTLKAACYLVLIAIPNVLSNSYENHQQSVPATLLEWLNVFLVLHIVQENIVSILENLSVISGKDKTAWITAIKEKFKVKQSD